MMESQTGVALFGESLDGDYYVAETFARLPFFIQQITIASTSVKCYYVFPEIVSFYECAEMRPKAHLRGSKYDLLRPALHRLLIFIWLYNF
jgi:hypothetical protein